MTEHTTAAATVTPEGPIVLEVVPLGFPWQTIDPFLFCVHHDDAYPEGRGDLAPVGSLEGRQLGSDFEGIDGWRMYHGHVVPGFPQHPHRGFETVTFVRRGLIDHADSAGATARYGEGDVQWLTAGSGVLHSEMFPLVHEDRPNPTELFQIWLNLPAKDKFAEPAFSILWDADIPRRTIRDRGGRSTTVTVVAGTFDGATPPPPPPASWASDPRSDMAIWHLELDAGAEVSLPPATGPDTVRALYVYRGAGVDVGGTEVDGSSVVAVDAARPTPLRAGPEPVEVLVLQGRPIGEPVAQYGPFVMNTEAEIHQAFADYRATGFGGWPWPADDPTHGAESRFARHANGREERP